MVVNQLKTVVLLGALMGLMLGVGQLLGGSQGLTIALVIALLFNGVMFFFSSSIVLMMYGAKEADRKTHAHLYKMVKELAEKANLPMPKVYITQNATPNAFATGRNPKNGVVCYTTAILDLLSDEELRGVTAHELAHIKNRDILITTIASVIAAVISYVGMMARFSAIFGGGRDRDGGDIASLLVLGILTPFIALILQLAISRSREYLADEKGASFVGHGKGLASALHRLETGVRQHPMQGNTAMSSLFIVNPFTMRGLTSLLSTHPPMSERIKRLEAMTF